MQQIDVSDFGDGQAASEQVDLIYIAEPSNNSRHSFQSPYIHSLFHIHGRNTIFNLT